jgi:hypothetical protein
METVNIVNQGQAPIIGDLSITSVKNHETVDVIDWEHYRVPFPNHHNLPEDSIAFMLDKERWDLSQNDKMF